MFWKRNKPVYPSQGQGGLPPHPVKGHPWDGEGSGLGWGVLGSQHGADGKQKLETDDLGC